MSFLIIAQEWLYNLGGISKETVQYGFNSIKDEQIHDWLQSIVG
jgi:hypothetical protein